MSVTELPSRQDEYSSGPSYDRTPPQDIAAEHSVLGGMLLSKDAIADVVEVLRGHDFYRPAHETIYEAILDLYGRGEPADAVTVAAQLQKNGDLGRVGGAPYLHTLVSSVPTAANAGYYASIVREHAILRRLVEAGTRIVQMGYTGDGDADDIVDQAQAEVYSVTERRASEDYLPLSEIMEGALDEIEAIGSRGGQMVGVPTGFADLDSLTNGLHPGQMVIVAARPALGKALALDTPLPTPTGWTTMGEVQVGEYLIGADGKPTRVVAATDVMLGRPCYEVEFSDGSVIVADAQHQWVTTRAQVPDLVGARSGLERDVSAPVTTREVAATLQDGHAVTLAEPVRLPYVDRPLPSSRTIIDARPIKSVPVRCVEVDAPDHLYLAGGSCIPTHNSTLGLDFCRAAAIKHQLTSVIFSLEMSRNEITTRLLSAEARVPLHHMRTGQMTEDDWNRIARRTGEVSSAPLFIDDSPNMTMMEIRAKCRRLKQRHDLRLVVVDYLQLMTSGKKVESRQQEVSEFSRSLKLLAKELEVPVVAIAQLNRGPEQRTDKKPMLADLRESGCLTADTSLLRADTGAPITFAELLERGHEGIQVWSLDEERRLVAAPLTNVFSSGEKHVYRLRLRSGREVKASGNHKFLTFDGWKRLDELAVKDRLAVPRRTLKPMAAGLGWSEHRIGLLAHLIGDGCVLRKQPLHYTSEDPANLTFVEEAAAAEFGITARRVQQRNWWHSYLPAPYKCARRKLNPLHEWFIELGIDDLRSHQKRVPEVMYSATDNEVATFLRHLWATDGRVAEPSSVKSGIPIISYASTSRALADGVLALLARFGIVARLTVVAEKNSPRPGYRVVIQSGPSMRTFCRLIGVHGARGERAARLLAELGGRAVNTNVDTLPRQVWDVVKAERQRAGLTERQFQAAIGTNYCGSALYKSGVSRERLMRCADALNSDILRKHASDDVFWDEIAEIEPLGREPVYDATVKGTHNFIADGLVAHNSLEQDSDVVLLLHREDAYERESPRAGEADFIVAKHRNGPTSTITVAFQGHYSRFVDMAQ